MCALQRSRAAACPACCAHGHHNTAMASPSAHTWPPRLQAGDGKGWRNSLLPFDQPSFLACVAATWGGVVSADGKVIETECEAITLQQLAFVVHTVRTACAPVPACPSHS